MALISLKMTLIRLRENFTIVMLYGRQNVGGLNQEDIGLLNYMIAIQHLFLILVLFYRMWIQAQICISVL